MSRTDEPELKLDGDDDYEPYVPVHKRQQQRFNRLLARRAPGVKQTEEAEEEAVIVLLFTTSLRLVLDTTL